MNITIKYFASMRDRMGHAEDKIQVSENATVKEAWDQLSNEVLPENTLIAVNMEYTHIEHALIEGDEVAFFPPVTGG